MVKKTTTFLPVSPRGTLSSESGRKLPGKGTWTHVHEQAAAGPRPSREALRPENALCGASHPGHIGPQDIPNSRSAQHPDREDAMADGPTVGFAPFATPTDGVLVVFCDDTLRLGPATRRLLGPAAALVGARGGGRPLQRQARKLARPRGAGRPQAVAARRRRLRQAGRHEAQGFRQARRHRDGQGSVARPRPRPSWPSFPARR